MIEICVYCHEKFEDEGIRDDSLTCNSCLPDLIIDQECYVFAVKENLDNLRGRLERLNDGK